MANEASTGVLPPMHIFSSQRSQTINPAAFEFELSRQEIIILLAIDISRRPPK
jgi:hypothetical protein